MVSFKLRLRHVFGKNMALCRILRIIKSNFSKNAPNVRVYEIVYMSCITYVKKFLNINPKAVNFSVDIFVYKQIKEVMIKSVALTNSLIDFCYILFSTYIQTILFLKHIFLN